MNVEESIVKNYEEEVTPAKKLLTTPVLVIGILIILSGIATGFLLSSKGIGLGSGGGAISGGTSGAKKTTIVGSDDTKTFNDQAEGVLETGGIDGEGSHHLVRPGGESQNVYLTSTTLDLEQFIGKKIKVWGQTNKARKAGWFMDVGKVEVLE